MGGAIFIGDELTAAGFRLTGIETIVVAPEDAGGVRAVLDEARKHAALVIMTADVAHYVPALDLESALLAEKPPLAIIPDVRFLVDPPDLTERLRRVLGIET